MPILGVPKIVAAAIDDGLMAGSEIMAEAFGEVTYKARGAEVEVLNPARAIYALVFYAELCGTRSDKASAMIKVAQRWEDAIGQAGRWTSTYEREC